MIYHPKPAKILIIRFSSIGDILLATPLIRVLHQKFPDAQIDFLTKAKFAELLDTNPFLHRVIRYHEKTKMRGLRQLKQEIIQENYDWLIDIHNNPRTLYLKLRNHIPEHFSIKKYRLKRFLLVKFKINLFSSVIPVYQRYLKPLQKYAIQDDRKGLEFYIDPQARSRIDEKYAGFWKKYPRIIGIVPGAGYPTKCWPTDRFARVAKSLIEKYNVGIIILGGKNDILLQNQILSQIDNSALGLAGELSLQESAAALDHCELVISNDTGLMHLTAALKKKLVAIFGNTSREFGFYPCAPQQIVLEKELPCRPCTHLGFHQCPEKHFKCMNDILPEEVQAAVVELLFYKSLLNLPGDPHPTPLP
ncbi:lipopolysaccharide heptosyltransferase II [candidate division KSB1 bacterium]|nr:lipopolysaccharide heptosyltransferase II [candidate division KSB1 bacterium]